MGVKKYAGTFPMASFNRKTCNHREKICGIKIIKIRNCFFNYATENNQVA